MGGSDGSIIIDVLLNTNQLDRQTQQTEAEVKSRFGKMGDSVKSFGKALAVGTAALVGMAAAAVALAAPFVAAAGEANALASQFTTVFGTLEKDATASLNAISKETSIMPERLKGAFVQMAAFAKSSGVDTAGALDLTTRATMAAADSAAFYDRSIEDVTESMQSFLKGNFENDAALGISATETTRNAAANKLYGKSFKDLSESQKQLTLLQMVEDGNKLTGALGQAAREADGYENVVGNLGQAFKNLQVDIGNLFFDQAIGAMKLLTEVVGQIDINGLVNKFKDLGSTYASTIDPIKSKAIDMVETIKSFWATNGAEIVANTQLFLGQVWEIVSGILGTVADFISRTIGIIVGLWKTNGQDIYDTVMRVFNLIWGFVQPYMVQIQEFIAKILNKILEFWEENGSQIVKAVTNIFNAVLAVIEFVMPAIKFIVDFIWEGIKNVISGALDVILGTVKLFASIFTGDFKGMWEGIKQIFSGAIEYIWGMMNLSFLGGIKKIFANLVEAGVSMIRSMWDNIVAIFAKMVKSPITYVAAMVAEFVQWLANLVVQGNAKVNELAVGMFNAIKDLPSKFLSIGKDIGRGLIDGIKSLNPIDYVKDLASDMVSSVKGKLKIFSPSRVFKSIGNDTMKGWILGMEAYEDESKEALINSMGFEDVVKNGASVVKLLDGINGLGTNYTIGVGGLLTPTSVAGVGGTSANIVNNNGNSSSIVVNGNTDVTELERLQRRMQFGF